ncbi:MAG: glycosyltransferase family 2 protein [Candidatus Levybacteria bacterium]|nr:glycosyltransferase family 2 protein [Candidatus Levybacteria bacterium]
MNLSVVVPVFNEEESLNFFYKELINVLSKHKIQHEIVFVDDGSTDLSLEILKEFSKQNNLVRVFSFRKNRGKSEALSCGFSKAKGDSVITMDADLQDKPSELLNLVAKLEEGYDHVSGWRKSRKDIGAKIIFSRVFNKTLDLLFGLKLHDYNCGLKAYTNEAAKSLRLYGGLHRFIPLLLYQNGFKVCEIPVSHSERKYGKSKFGVSKIWKDLPDMLTMIFLVKYSNKPLHFFGFIGLLFLFVGFSILLYLSSIKIFFDQGIGNRPILFLGILLVLGGFQVLFTGFLADLIINISNKERKEFPLRYSSEN